MNLYDKCYQAPTGTKFSQLNLDDKSQTITNWYESYFKTPSTVSYKTPQQWLVRSLKQLEHIFYLKQVNLVETVVAPSTSKLGISEENLKQRNTSVVI